MAYQTIISLIFFCSICGQIDNNNNFTDGYAMLHSTNNATYLHARFAYIIYHSRNKTNWTENKILRGVEGKVEVRSKRRTDACLTENGRCLTVCFLKTSSDVNPSLRNTKLPQSSDLRSNFMYFFKRRSLFIFLLNVSRKSQATNKFLVFS